MINQQKNSLFFKITETRKNLICFLLFASLSIAVMVAIFLFSSQTAENSAALSGEFKGIVDKVLNCFKWLFSDGAILWIKNHIRKIAHFALYTLLGAFLSAATLNTRLKSLSARFFLPVGIGLFYSITDEIHQLFIEGRSGEIRDVFIDFSGVISGSIIAFLIYKTAKNIAKNRKKT